MELHWLNRSQSDRLILFALGWAADHRIVEHIRPEGYDILTLYDYRPGSGDAGRLRDEVEKYPRRWLVAWSFGVWAAERALGGIGFEGALALNGTPFPVDDLYGIEPRRLAVTLRGLRSGGMEAFDRRAYGDDYPRLRHLLSPRPLGDNIAELEFLAEASVRQYEPSIRWDGAVVGSGDKIFPPENMARYWGSRARLLPLPHYPFGKGELILRELGI